jgi:hypothetical protein
LIVIVRAGACTVTNQAVTPLTFCASVARTVAFTLIRL